MWRKNKAREVKKELNEEKAFLYLSCLMSWKIETEALSKALLLKVQHYTATEKTYRKNGLKNIQLELNSCSSNTTQIMVRREHVMSGECRSQLPLLTAPTVTPPNTARLCHPAGTSHGKSCERPLSKLVLSHSLAQQQIQKCRQTNSSTSGLCM